VSAHRAVVWDLAFKSRRSHEFPLLEGYQDLPQLAIVVDHATRRPAAGDASPTTARQGRQPGSQPDVVPVHHAGDHPVASQTLGEVEVAVDQVDGRQPVAPCRLQDGPQPPAGLRHGRLGGVPPVLPASNRTTPIHQETALDGANGLAPALTITIPSSGWPTDSASLVRRRSRAWPSWATGGSDQPAADRIRAATRLHSSSVSIALMFGSLP
jgi:hypothetical protein